MKTEPSAADNRLLGHLSARCLSSLDRDMEQIALSSSEIIYDTGCLIDHVYFPSDGLMLSMKVFDDGTQVEVGMIGREGMIGQSVLHGINMSPTKIIMQFSGKALRMSASAFITHVGSSLSFQSIVSSYNEGIHVQLGQVAACNARHSLEQRLIRSLLTAYDRSGQANLHLTQTMLASMLGVQRPSVTVVALALRQAGLIRYSQGQIIIINKIGLEKLACECYGKMRIENS